LNNTNHLFFICCRVGNDIDEADLEAELAGLEDEWADEVESTTTSTPAYLSTTAEDLPTAPSTGLKSNANTAPAVDEYGLPLAPIAMH